MISSILTREARFWSHSARAAGITGGESQWRMAVAVATMTQADTLDEAVMALRAIPGLQAAERPALVAMAGWLRELYARGRPKSGEVAGGRDDSELSPWFRPLSPDPLGEALVARTAGEAPGLAGRLLAEGTPTQVIRTLTVLNLSARSHRGAAEALGAGLRTNFASLWPPAMDVAEATGEPMAGLLAAVVADLDDSPLIGAIEAALPESPGILSDFAVAATVVARERAASATGPEPSSEVARLDQAIARRLLDAGRHEEALVAAERSRAAYETLAEASPRQYALSRGAARLLVARCLAELELLGTGSLVSEGLQELITVGFSRPLNELTVLTALIQSRWGFLVPDTLRLLVGRDPMPLLGHIPRIVRRLTPLGVLRDLHQLVAVRPGGVFGKLRSFDRAAAEGFLLAQQMLADPFMPVVSGLEELCEIRMITGEFEEVLEATEQASELRRAAGSMGTAMSPEQFVRSRSRAAACLRYLHRYAEAEQQSEAAVTMWRQLASDRPASYRGELAEALTIHSVVLSATGRHDDALERSREAMEFLREVTAHRPGRFGVALAAALHEHGKQLRALDCDEEASAIADESHSLLQRLVSERPRDTLPAIGRMLNRRAQELMASGRDEEGLAASQDRIDLLHEAAPPGWESHAALGRALMAHAENLHRAGRDHEALATSRQADDVFAGLDADPTIGGVQYDYWRALATLAELLDRDGDRQEHLKVMDRLARVTARVVHENPELLTRDDVPDEHRAALSRIALAGVAAEFRSWLESLSDAVERAQHGADGSEDEGLAKLADLLSQARWP